MYVLSLPLLCLQTDIMLTGGFDFGDTAAFHFTDEDDTEIRVPF